MALDASSNWNFNTRNSEEAVKVIENLASSSSTKNTDFERKRSATILGNDQMDEVKAKLDSVHKLLRKQVCLVEDAEAVDTEGRAEEADVNFISGTGFQGSGNQGGNRNSYGNRGNFNQSSQHQKPYSNNYNNNRGYGSSYYQKPPPPTQESKIEEMLDRVLEGQQRMTVDFNGKIDSVYTNLNTKFETLSTHVKKLEMKVVQTGEA